MAYTQKQWNDLQASLPAEDRVSYLDYLKIAEPTKYNNLSSAALTKLKADSIEVKTTAIVDESTKRAAMGTNTATQNAAAEAAAKVEATRAALAKLTSGKTLTDEEKKLLSIGVTAPTPPSKPSTVSDFRAKEEADAAKAPKESISAVEALAQKRAAEAAAKVPSIYAKGGRIDSAGNYNAYNPQMEGMTSASSSPTAVLTPAQSVPVPLSAAKKAEDARVEAEYQAYLAEQRATQAAAEKAAKDAQAAAEQAAKAQADAKAAQDAADKAAKDALTASGTDKAEAEAAAAFLAEQAVTATELAAATQAAADAAAANADATAALPGAEGTALTAPTLITPTPTSTVTPIVTPEVTPTVVPTVTPVENDVPLPIDGDINYNLGAEVTPVVTPEVTPIVTPEVMPIDTPEVTPIVTPTVTPTTPSPDDIKNAQALAARQSAYDLLYSTFAEYGLSSLVEPLKGLIQSNISPSEFAIKLRTDPLYNTAYKKRFAANDMRISKGLKAISEAEYLANEDQYQSILRNAGLPESYWKRGDLGVQEGFTNFIANDVSAAELEDRVNTAQQRLIYANPEVSIALKTFYPDISNGDLLAYALDPTKGLEQIKRRITAAEIGSSAVQLGLATNVTDAEYLARYGVNKAQAQQGYRTAAEILPTASKLGDIYSKQGLGAYTQQTAEQEIFNVPGAAEAAAKRRKLSELEQASFSGKAGMGALARDRAGAF